MKKLRFHGTVISIIGIVMIFSGYVIYSDNALKKVPYSQSVTNAISMSLANRNTNVKLEENNDSSGIIELSMKQTPQSIYIPPRVEVYEGMTMEELSDKLNRSLGSGYIAGKGLIIAKRCIELGVDPYIATAIILHETGCGTSKCSSIARNCNNFGGQKGGPSCNGGSYKYYQTIDEGLIGHIDNLYNKYYVFGYNTVETIGPRYAESNTWIPKINWYVEKIRAS